MFHFVYKTTCKTNGKYYIGMHSTRDINDGYLGSGTILKKAVSKYGIENFEREIICYEETREALIKSEYDILKSIPVSDKLCYNIIRGGKRQRGAHEEDRPIYRVDFEPFAQKYYHFYTIGNLYEHRVSDNKVLNTIYSVFQTCNKRIAEDLSYLFNNKKTNDTAKIVINKIKETADYPDNLIIEEMDWVCILQ